VDINPPTIQFATMVDADTWEKVNREVSFLKQMTQESIAVNSFSDYSSVHSTIYTKTSTEGLDESDAITPTLDEIQLAKPTHLVHTENHQEHGNSTVSSAIPQSSELGSVTFMAAISKQNVLGLIKKHGIDQFRNFLEKTSSLYLRDTGGQVEFQEMLPLIVFGPSIFFFVFRADLDFQKHFSIEYRKSESESLNCYKSSITTEEALLQCLASVHAMDVPDKHDVQTHQPFVFIIGTHIDRIPSSTADKIAQLNQHINTLILDHGFQDLVEYYDRGSNSVIFPVDNTSDSVEGFKKIRSKVNSLVWVRDEFAVTYPVSYLLVCLELQKVDANVLTLTQFRSLAARHNIVGNEVFHLLHFLHFRIGIIQYYDVDGLRDIIVVQPQVLFNAITDLIIETYSCESLKDQEARKFKDRGIFTRSVLNTVLNATSSKLLSSTLGGVFNTGVFLKLLVHLRIITLFTTTCDQEEYFIPCVLGHVAVSSSKGSKSDSQPLFITFKCNHCPKGVFGVLITHLMNPDLRGEEDTTSKFILLPEKIFRDQVSFEVRSKGMQSDEITVQVFSTHLEISFLPDLGEDREVSVGEVCQDIRETFEKSIDRTIENLRYSKVKVQPNVCIKCCNEGCSKFHVVFRGTEFYKFRCDHARRASRLPLPVRCWYNEGK
jgi:GTPase SAR1 family protein